MLQWEDYAGREGAFISKAELIKTYSKEAVQFLLSCGLIVESRALCSVRSQSEPVCWLSEKGRERAKQGLDRMRRG
tara:strand:- start:1702 stop:1929 length:228 start_codon:yes stop_codon:yes gene_type:complete